MLAHKFGWDAEGVRSDLAFYWLEALRVELEPSSAGPASSSRARLRTARGDPAQKPRQSRWA